MTLTPVSEGCYSAVQREDVALAPKYGFHQPRRLPLEQEVIVEGPLLIQTIKQLQK